MTELELLLDHVRRMQAVHASGGIYYAQSKEWDSTYGWHNPLFPPEYRSCCLNGKEFDADPSCDLYYFMACYYEMITGQRPPHNFELDRLWKERLRSAMEACRSASQSGKPNWSPIHQNALQGIIRNCTRWKQQKRIQNAGELLETDEMKALILLFPPDTRL